MGGRRAPMTALLEVMRVSKHGRSAALLWPGPGAQQVYLLCVFARPQSQPAMWRPSSRPASRSPPRLWSSAAAQRRYIVRCTLSTSPPARQRSLLRRSRVRSSAAPSSPERQAPSPTTPLSRRPGPGNGRSPGARPRHCLRKRLSISARLYLRPSATAACPRLRLRCRGAGKALAGAAAGIADGASGTIAAAEPWLSRPPRAERRPCARSAMQLAQQPAQVSGDPWWGHRHSRRGSFAPSAPTPQALLR